MNPAVPAPVQALAPDIARRVGLIVAGLAALVACRFLRDPRLATLIVPLWTRLQRIAGRVTRLMLRLAAGKPPAHRPPRPGRPAPSPNARPAAPLPAFHGWLIRALPQEAAAYASQLESLLNEPAMAELIASFPAAGRILRPLGHMLGLPAPILKNSAPKRSAPAPKGCAPATPPQAAPPRPSLPPSHPLAPYRRSARWPGPRSPGPPRAQPA